MGCRPGISCLAVLLGCWLLGHVGEAKSVLQRIEIQTTAGPSFSLSNPVSLPWNVFHHGQQVNITCRDALAPDSIPILLQQNGMALVSSVQEQRGVKATTQRHGLTQLTIASFSQLNEGNYTCLYQTWTSDVISETVSLQMARQPVVTMQAVTLANISQRFQLACIATGVPLPQIKFVSPTTGVVPSNQSEIIRRSPTGQKYVQLTWQRPRATLHDEGVYECVATNVLSRQRQTGKISVQFPAAVLSTLHKGTRKLPIGRKAVLQKCVATGNPLPTVAWQLNGSIVLVSNDHVSIATMETSNHTVTSTLAVARLSPSMTGIYTCQVKNVLGNQSRQEAIIPVFPPSAPRELAISRAGLTAVTLSWKVPSWFGNADDIKYEVLIFDTSRGPARSHRSLIRTDNRTYIHFVPPAGHFTIISNLEVNTAYGFLLLSKNIAGSSKPSAYVQTQTLPDTPPAPVNISITDPEATSFNITWQLPQMLESQGKLSEIQFIVRARLHSGLLADIGIFEEVCTTTEHGCEVMKLEKGSQYQVVVQASNRGGMGAPSIVVIAETAISVSSPPVWLGARITGLESLTLMWALPADSGGSPVTYWLLKYGDSGDNATTLETKIEAGVLFYPVEGLDEFETYEFELHAVNHAGRSESATLVFTMPGHDDPRQPESVEVLATSSQSIIVAIDGSAAHSAKDLIDDEVLSGEIGLLNHRAEPARRSKGVTYLIRYRSSQSQPWMLMEVEDKETPVCVNHLSYNTVYTVQTAVKRNDDISLYSIPVTAQTESRFSVPSPVLRVFGRSAVKVSWPACGPHWKPFTVQLWQVAKYNRNYLRPILGAATSAHSRSMNEAVVLKSMEPGVIYQLRILVNRMGEKYYSRNVTFTMPTEEAKEESPGTAYESSTMSVGIISFAAGGGLLLALLLVAGLLVWRKRQLRQDAANKAFVDIPGDTATPSWMSDHTTVSSETSFVPQSFMSGGDNILNNMVASGLQTPSLAGASRTTSENRDSGEPVVTTPSTVFRAPTVSNEHEMVEAELSYAVLSLPDVDTNALPPRRPAERQPVEYAQIACIRTASTTAPRLMNSLTRDKGKAEQESENEANNYYDEAEAVEECRAHYQQEMSHDF